MKQRTMDNMIQLGQVLYNAGLVASTGGNLSYQEYYMPDRIRVTASGSHLGFLEPGDFVPFDAVSGEQIGDQKSSIETPFHLEIYRQTATKVIAHVHAPNVLKCLARQSRGSIHAYNRETEALLPLIGVIPRETPDMPHNYSSKIIVPPVSSGVREDLLIEDLQPTLKLLENGKRIIVYTYHGIVAFGTTPLEVLNYLELLDSMVSLDYSNVNTEKLVWK